jgi:hypothetical protein
MGGFLPIAICLAGAITLYGTGHPILFGLAVVVSVISFWTLGLMHNFAADSAKSQNDRLIENMAAEGRSNEEIERVNSRIIRYSSADLNAVPNSLAMVDMIATAVGAILLVCGLAIRVL